MRNALEALPWVRKAAVDYAAQSATVTVERKLYVPQELIESLQKAGFGGKIQEEKKQAKKKAVTAQPRVTFHVIGMKKTKSGAT